MFLPKSPFSGSVAGGFRVAGPLLPIVIVLAGVSVTSALSLSIKAQQRDDIHRVVRGEAEAVSRAVENSVTSHVQTLIQMGKRWELLKPSEAEWEADARLQLAHSSGFESLEWVDPSFQTLWSVYTGGRKFIDADAAFGEPREQVLQKARQRLAPTVSRAFALPRGGHGLLIYTPIFVGPNADKFEGFIAAALNVYSMMTGLLDATLLPRYDLEISEGGKTIYTKPGAQNETRERWGQETDMKLYGVVWFGTLWKIRVWPTPGWLAGMRSSLGDFVLAAGLVLTALLALLAHIFHLARTRAHQLEIANANLKSEVSERQRAQAALADFTAMIAHDLRSPLTNVKGIATMMQDGLFGPVNEEQWKWLAKVEATSEHLVDLVSDFLDVSKLEAGRIDLVKEEVNLKQLIQDSLENYLASNREKKHSFKNCVDADLPRITADRRRLEQVFGNLLSNAVKFTGEDGEIEVGASQNDGREVKIWMKDSGVGIPAAEIGGLFQKYRQTTSGKTAGRKGTGLGLVICKMIVEAHGGNIRVESQEGQGTTFIFTLPVRPG